MLELAPGHLLATSVLDLPKPRPGRVFLDCETRYHKDEPEELNNGGLFPYLGDRACMWSVAFDDEGPAVAVPFRMRSSPNLPVDGVLRWLRDLLQVATHWTNHMVKFDAHFAAVDGALFPETCQLECTNVLAKLIDSDRFSHDLKDLCREWIGADYQSEDRVKAFLAGYKLPNRRKAKDYALVPSDILGFYGCDDVLHNRSLFRHCLENLPEQVRPTWEMEKKLTPVLFDMEREGMRTDDQELRKSRIVSIHKQIKLATRLNEITGTEFADSSAYSYALLIGKWGLPVLDRDKKTGNPSFKYESLLLYQGHPEVVADPIKSEAIATMLKLRDEETFCSLFVDVFLEHRGEDGKVHPSYNQLVRTGRMSCVKPNAQQFDGRAKSLVLTDSADDAFLDADASQIEFRFIVHHIKDESAIAAYIANPRTDFHQWVADLCKIKRKPAKNINFATAFGGGKAKIVSMLASDESIVSAVGSEVGAAIAAGRLKPENRMVAFKELCWRHGEAVYNTYHERLPTLKPTALRAADVARARGFVFNIYGRRRHLPQKGAHVAFNTLCQGGAMDLIKRRMIATAPRYNSELRADGITIKANVHDALLYHGHRDAIAKWRPWILEQLEAPEPLLRVPVVWESEVKTERWEKAS
jgi:DNA polymerase-1